MQIQGYYYSIVALPLRNTASLFVVVAYGGMPGGVGLRPFSLILVVLPAIVNAIVPATVGTLEDLPLPLALLDCEALSIVAQHSDEGVEFGGETLDFMLSRFVTGSGVREYLAKVALDGARA